MSRSGAPSHRCVTGFPRVSGDEPQVLTLAEAAEMFSPRERG